jgi:hypothetical protein
MKRMHRAPAHRADQRPDHDRAPHPAVVALHAGLASIALALTMSGHALAEPGQGGGWKRLTPEQQQKVYPELKRLSLQNHRERIGILQRGERCISAAGSSDAIFGCMREQRQANRTQRQKHQEGMRAMFERNGIEVPEWGRRRPGPRGRGPGPDA